MALQNANNSNTQLPRAKINNLYKTLGLFLVKFWGVPVKYGLRWGAEENYKRLKQWVEIENFSGKSVLSVKQDFYAKVLSTNLTAMVANAAQQQVDKATAHRKHDYQVNFAQALSKMKNILIELLLLSVRKLQGKLEALIDYIACTIEPIRRGRSYSRKNSKSKNRIFYCNYKRAK